MAAVAAPVDRIAPLGTTFQKAIGSVSKNVTQVSDSRTKIDRVLKGFTEGATLVAQALKSLPKSDPHRINTDAVKGFFSTVRDGLSFFNALGGSIPKTVQSARAFYHLAASLGNGRGISFDSAEDENLQKVKEGPVYANDAEKGLGMVAEGATVIEQLAYLGCFVVCKPVIIAGKIDKNICDNNQWAGTTAPILMFVNHIAKVTGKTAELVRNSIRTPVATNKVTQAEAEVQRYNDIFGNAADLTVAALETVGDVGSLFPNLGMLLVGLISKFISAIIGIVRIWWK